MDSCAGFKNAFLMVRNYNDRPASRRNKTRNQDIREASEIVTFAEPERTEKLGVLL